MVSRFELGSVSDLLTAMRISGAVVSGSYPLIVLFPGAFQPNDLDFYVPIKYRHFLVSFLVTKGYTAIHTANAYNFFATSSITVVHRFAREVDGHRFPTINVVCVGRTSPIVAVADFHSTVAMNFIAYYGFVCLYPELTLRRQGLVLDSTGRHVAWVDKYRGRGFTLDVPVPTTPQICRGRRLLDETEVLFVALSGPLDRLSSYEDEYILTLTSVFHFFCFLFSDSLNMLSVVSSAGEYVWYKPMGGAAVLRNREFYGRRVVLFFFFFRAAYVTLVYFPCNNNVYLSIIFLILFASLDNGIVDTLER